MTYLFSSNTAITNEVEVKNDVGNPIPISGNVYLNNSTSVVSITNPLPVTGVEGSPITVTFSGATVDAFGRLRTSSPHTIFDNYFTIDEKSKVWDTDKVNGTAVFKPNLSAIDMGVNSTSGSKVIRQTKQYFQYQPGKSLLTLNTFVMNEGKANLRQRVGYFDSRDGIFLEREGNTAYIVKRSFVTGSSVDTRVAQTNWNVDKLDGNGISRLNLNLDKSQIFFTDIEWLGVGTVRTGFIIDGKYHIAHSFHHANLESNVYMTQATLPIRYEIENIGTTTGTSNLKQICSTVISEAGYTPAVITRSASTALTGLDMSQNDFRPLMSLRLKSGETDHVVLPAELYLFGLQTTPFTFKLVGNANVIGGVWETTGVDSVVQYNANATTLGTGGYEMIQGMFVGGTGAQPVTINLKNHNHSLQLRANIGGVSEVFCVAVKATTNNDRALGTISWEEQA